MPGTDTAVTARGVRKGYGTVAALKGLDLSVAAGEVRGLVGPNGAGKTTLLRILLGLVQADSGELAVLGRDPWADGARARENVGGFAEVPRFYGYLSARRNLELLARLDGRSSGAGPALDAVGLGDRAGDRVSGFSSGMVQRLGIAAALLRAPHVLLLDEPANGLDPTGARDLRALLRRLADDGCAVLLSSHDMAEVESLCDSATVIADGHAVADGTLAELRARAPSPRYVIATSDDVLALQVATASQGITAARRRSGGLTVGAEQPALDELVLVLASHRVAVRRLELEVVPLASLYFTLTGASTDRVVA